MSYFPLQGPPPPFPIFQSFESPWQGAPGPVPPPPSGTVPGPTMPAQLFPTNLRWGDVVNVTGPFQGLFQGQVRVKFTGAPWQAPTMQGPFSASVIVPEGAQTGECAIEINGRRAFGTQCVITPATGFRGQRVAPSVGPYGEAWKNYGDLSGNVQEVFRQAQEPKESYEDIIKPVLIVASIVAMSWLWRKV